MNINRRRVLGAALAGAAGVLGTASRLDAHTGQIAEGEVKRLALEARTAADYKRLAEHFQTLKAAAEKEAAVYEAIAKTYRKGHEGVTEFLAKDAARAFEHVAEHARDSAEALEHLAEAFEGWVENLNG